MRTMLGGTAAGLSAAAAELVSLTKSDPAALRKALEALDTAFASHKEGAIFKGIREAMQACHEVRPIRSRD